MAENHTQGQQNSIAKQEQELRSLLEQLIISDQPTEAERPSPASVPDTTSASRDPNRFRYFTPRKPLFIDPVWSDDEDEEDADEDDIFLDNLPLVLDEYECDDEDMDEDEGGFIPVVTPGITEKTAAPSTPRQPREVLWSALCASVPLRRENIHTLVRKCVLWAVLAVCAGALAYVLYAVWWQPTYTRGVYDSAAADYQAELTGAVADPAYPTGMLQSFQKLYDRNADVRGWLSFHANGTQDFLNIEYPIVYSGDNTTYLTTDFNGKENKDGAVFFDMHTVPQSAADKNRVLIAYGKSPSNGQLFAGMSNLIGNVNNARSAATLTMNTLFANGEYKVFAVILTDKYAAAGNRFSVHRTEFADDDDFEQYISDLRARSLFNYPITVLPQDELLVLSTGTSASSSMLENGYLTVVARRVREGENPAVNTAGIVLNDDVIMPYAWYVKQGKAVHEHYKTSATTGSTLDGAFGAIPSEETADTSAASTTATVTDLPTADPSADTTTGTTAVRESLASGKKTTTVSSDSGMTTASTTATTASTTLRDMLSAGKKTTAVTTTTTTQRSPSRTTSRATTSTTTTTTTATSTSQSSASSSVSSGTGSSAPTGTP